MEVGQSFHRAQRFCQFCHVIFQRSTYQTASTSVIEISLSVIIHKNTGVYHGETVIFHALHFEVGIQYGEIRSRFLTGSDTYTPSVVPVITAGMGKVEVICAVLVSAVGCPHESSILTSPRHLRGVEDFAMVSPMYHIIGGENVVTIHQVATSWRIHVM